MDRTITASQANQRFSEMLRQVQQGDSFTITSRGRPVARMAPAVSEHEAQIARQRELLEYVKTLPQRQAYGWKREDLYE